MAYSKITKTELIKILELERAEHDTTKRGLESMSKQFSKMNDLVTARQEWEADHG